MGSTNKTSNYELSQFIGTDKPSWLNDYDGDMLKIDTQMKANATAAATAQSKADTADGKADINANVIDTLNTQINAPSTGLAAVVSGHTLDISGIDTTIGNTILPTTDQTITGAIAEDHTKLATLLVNGLSSAVNITTYASSDNMYILPADGYVHGTNSASSSASFGFEVYDASGVNHFSVGNTGTSNVDTCQLYLKKGMKVYAHASTFLLFYALS